MNLEEIEVYIDAAGQVRIEVRGVKGPNCLSLIQPLEKALGGQVLERIMTAEANEVSPVQLDQAQNLRT